MTAMFGANSSDGTVYMKLSKLNIEHFNTSKVTNMRGMFQNCTLLTSLDLSTWDTSNVENTEKMFQYTNSLKELKLNKANFSKVTSYTNMFYKSGIETISINPISETFIKSRLNEAGISPSIIIV